MFSDLMNGAWRLPPDRWAFLLCGALDLLICDVDEEDHAFQPYYIPDNVGTEGSSSYVKSSTVSFIRWCHRLCPSALYPATGSTPTKAAKRIDPLAAVAGCDRLAWARVGEGGDPEGYGALNSSIRSKISAFRAARPGGNGPQEQGKAHQCAVRARAVSGARAALRAFTAGRFRSDDAFAGRAYCEVLSTLVSATPVSVMPDFACSRRKAGWEPASSSRSSQTRGLWARFARSQGHLLSGFHQFRLNLLVNPGQLDIDDEDDDAGAVG